MLDLKFINLDTLEEKELPVFEWEKVVIKFKVYYHNEPESISRSLINSYRPQQEVIFTYKYVVETCTTQILTDENQVEVIIQANHLYPGNSKQINTFI